MKKIDYILLSLFALFILGSTFSYASDHGSVWGYVFDENSVPLPAVAIRITGKKGEFPDQQFSDDAGYFRVTGIPSGKHVITFAIDGYQQRTEEKIWTLPSQAVYCEAILYPNGHAFASTSHPVLLDDTQSVFQTPLISACGVERHGPNSPVPYIKVGLHFFSLTRSCKARIYLLHRFSL